MESDTMKRLGAFAVIRDEEDRVLLVKQKRSRRAWTLPGGKVDDGERVLDGLRRELMEETGLEVNPRQLVAVISREESQYLILVFQCNIVKRHRIRFSDHEEIEKMAFFAVDDPPTPLSMQAAAVLHRLRHIQREAPPFIEMAS